MPVPIVTADSTGTIVNDDNVPRLTIDDVTRTEGNSGTTAFTFTVSKVGTTAFPASVDFQTVDGTATVADNDYQATSGTLTFAPGETIHTENSYKFTGESLAELFGHAGFKPVHSFIDDESLFAVTLAAVV